MEQPPRRHGVPLLGWDHLVQAVWQGLVVSGAVLALYALGLQQGWSDGQSRTAAFAGLVLTNAGLIVLMRSYRLGARRVWADLRGVTAWVLGGTLLALLLVVYWPVAAKAFAFAPLTGPQWAMVLFTTVGGLLVLQLSQIAVRVWRPQPRA